MEKVIEVYSPDAKRDKSRLQITTLLISFLTYMSNIIHIICQYIANF
jgi:hypothetical protein